MPKALLEHLARYPEADERCDHLADAVGHGLSVALLEGVAARLNGGVDDIARDHGQDARTLSTRSVVRHMLVHIPRVGEALAAPIFELHFVAHFEREFRSDVRFLVPRIGLGNRVGDAIGIYALIKLANAVLHVAPVLGHHLG